MVSRKREEIRGIRLLLVPESEKISDFCVRKNSKTPETVSAAWEKLLRDEFRIWRDRRKKLWIGGKLLAVGRVSFSTINSIL